MRSLRHTRPALAGSIPVRAAEDPVQATNQERGAWRSAPLSLRVRACLGRRGIDRRILAGDPVDGAPALALRAAQLTDPQTRRQTARRLRGIVDYVDRSGPRPLITAVVIDPPAVRSGRQAILGLAQRLEAGGQVEPRGVILAQRLLTDGLGPLFKPEQRADGDRSRLGDRRRSGGACHARDRLHHRGPARGDAACRSAARHGGGQ